MSSQGQVAKRLQSELMQLMLSPVEGVSAFPEEDNLLSWKATIQGASEGPYAGQEYTLSMNFPTNYPISPPTVKFETPIFHPNIDMSGNICLDILKDKWTATYSVTTLLLSIQALLETPNNDSPLNNQAAELWSNSEEYLRLVKRRYANLPLA